MKLTKIQKAALLALAADPSMLRTKFKDQTWMALCDKRLCYPNGCFGYAYLAPVLSNKGSEVVRKLKGERTTPSRQLQAAAKPKHYPPLRLVVG